MFLGWKNVVRREGLAFEPVAVSLEQRTEMKVRGVGLAYDVQ